MPQQTAAIFYPFESVANLYVRVLSDMGIDAKYFPDSHSPRDILDQLRRESPNLAIIASTFHNGCDLLQSGLEKLAQLGIPIVIVENGMPCREEAIRLGARDYFGCGEHLSPDEIKARLRKAIGPQS